MTQACLSESPVLANSVLLIGRRTVCLHIDGSIKNACVTNWCLLRTILYSPKGDHYIQMKSLIPSGLLISTCIFRMQFRLYHHPLFEELGTSTHLGVRTSSSQFNEIDHILLAGGNANIPGLAKLLQQKLGYRVTIANPFLQMGFSPQIDIKKIENDASSLMVACGLALRSFD